MNDDVRLGEQGRQNMAIPVLVQYLQVALRWRFVVAGIIAAALAIGLVVTLLTTPQYTAVARIEISRDQKNITKVEGVESSTAGQDLEFYQTQYNLLQARSLAEYVARKLRLAQSDQFAEAHGIDFSAGLFGIDSGRPMTRDEMHAREEAVVKILLDHVEISPLRGSALVDIRYTSGSPQLSAQIANEWTQQYIAMDLQRRFASTADARTFLEGRLEDLRSKLETSERNVVNYASNKDIVALGKAPGSEGAGTGDQTLVSSDLQALNAQLVQATADRIAAEARMRAGSDKGAAPDPLIANTALAQLRQKRAEVSAEYAKLLVKFDPKYPAAEALQQQIASLDSAIRREEGRLVGLSGSVRSADYKAALERESNLRGKVNALKSRLDLQQRDSIQYNIYKRDADTNRQLYDALLQRYKEIGVAGVGANNIAIIDEALPPNKPSKPSLPLNLLLALLGGLVAAVATVLALDQIDESLRDPSQVNQVLRLPLLGTIPDTDEGDALERLSDVKSDISEAYFSVRSNLAFSTDHGVPRSLMISSSRPAEGKSTTSFAIATVLARTGMNVILIDADMRSPSIHGFVDQTNEFGLSNLLSGTDDWQGMVRTGVETGLDFIAAGPTPPSAAELLSSNRMTELVRKLGETYDCVVIDCPPVLGLADAPLLSRAVEGCIFVSEAEGVSVRGIKSAIGRLEAVHAHIFGIVLTKLRQKSAGYGYGYDYGYGYGRQSD
ncbi:polysaccharide biosynthesis tyrosine autokinase [Tsuneonella flava]|uniref:non-specific protein-tyrosine kinase n=1 Tax=Tsuneonella flava TaxID=2055955 RepID=A0ABX7KC31_9SPHN|nr:polysaccharide biosynthesis tyrosine autokinase [Tsuneonella flava]QSB45027.1 polysaccharide biosynthesis tyrosine autokinase [Tsuneonella flava]